jgi:hypothetical protein
VIPEGEQGRPSAIVHQDNYASRDMYVSGGAQTVNNIGCQVVVAPRLTALAAGVRTHAEEVAGLAPVPADQYPACGLDTPRDSVREIASANSDNPPIPLRVPRVQAPDHPVAPRRQAEPMTSMPRLTADIASSS